MGEFDAKSEGKSEDQLLNRFDYLVKKVYEEIKELNVTDLNMNYIEKMYKNLDEIKQLSSVIEKSEKHSMLKELVEMIQNLKNDIFEVSEKLYDYHSATNKTTMLMETKTIVSELKNFMMYLVNYTVSDNTFNSTLYSDNFKNITEIINTLKDDIYAVNIDDLRFAAMEYVLSADEAVNSDLKDLENFLSEIESVLTKLDDEIETSESNLEDISIYIT